MYIYGNNPQTSSRADRIIKSTNVSMSNVLSRKASIWSMNGGGNPLQASGGPISRLSMKPFSPLFQESNLMLPKDRRTMNAFNRHYYETDYWVGNAIDLHTTYPLGGFQIMSKDKEVERTMQKMAQRLDLSNLVLAVGQQYWLYGESFPFLEWDPNEKMWGRATIFNPDLIEVKKTIFTDKPIISLVPDSELKRIATSTNPMDVAARSAIPQEIMDYVMKGENIPLNFRNVSHVCRKTVFHDPRGTSIIQRVWKELMLRDAFREVLFVMAQNHVTPIKIFKIGGKEKDYFPTEDDLSYWQNMIEEAQNDPNFSIITHDAVDVQYVGANGHVLDVTAYIKLFEDNVLTGLMANKVLITGEGPSYANASVAYEVQQQRYMFFRNVIEQWLINKVFLPVSIQHGFKDNHGKYKIPLIKWRRMDFMKDSDWRRNLIDLNGREAKIISDRTLVTEMGMDYDEEQELLMKEKVISMTRKNKLKEMNAQMEAGGGIPGMGGAGGGGLGGGGGMPGAIPGMEGLGGAGGPGGAPPGGEGFAGAGAPPGGPAPEGAGGAAATTFATPAI